MKKNSVKLYLSIHIQNFVTSCSQSLNDLFMNKANTDSCQTKLPLSIEYKVQHIYYYFLLWKTSNFHLILQPNKCLLLMSSVLFVWTPLIHFITAVRRWRVPNTKTPEFSSQN